MRIRAGLTAVIMVALAACGTTVSSSSRAGTGAGGTAGGGTGLASGDGLAAPGSTPAVPPAAAGQQPAGGTGATSSGSSGSPGATRPDTSTAAGPSAGGGSPANAPGVTATTISLGLPYITNSGAARAALGIGGVSNGDMRTEWQILVDDLNAHGGIARHKIVPVYYAIDATSSQTYAQQAQAECAAFTQDHHVFAVLDGGVDTLISCVAQHNTAEVFENASLNAAAVFKQHVLYAEPSGFTLERQARQLIASLVDERYFSPWSSVTAGPGQLPAKVGVLTLDDPQFGAATRDVLLPALAAAGYPHPDVYSVSPNASTGDLVTPVGQLASAVLKFKADGVSHVIILEGSGLLYFFAQAARSQGYFPRYGLNTQSGAELLLSSGNLQANDVRGALGYGWMPMIDLQPKDNLLTGPYANAARRSCVGLLRAHSQTLPDAVAERAAMNFCDELQFVKAAIEAGGAPISMTSYVAGIAAMRQSFVDANTFATSFGGARHDGGETARRFAFQGPCACFRYTSDPFVVP